MSHYIQRTISVRVHHATLDWNVTAPLCTTPRLTGKATFADGRGVTFTDHMFNKQYDISELDVQMVPEAEKRERGLHIRGTRTRDSVAGAMELTLPIDFFERFLAMQMGTNGDLEIAVTFPINKFRYSTKEGVTVPFGEVHMTVASVSWHRG